MAAGTTRDNPRTVTVLVVDAYDAMSTDRSYRAALPPEAIRAELEQNAGKQFDPDLTALLLRLLEEDTVL